MRDEELAEIEKRAAAATPGPWQIGIAGRCDVVYFNGDDIYGVAQVGDDTLADRADRGFIAAARTDVPTLLAEVRRLRVQVAALEAERGEWRLLTESAEFRTGEALARVGALERGQDVATKALAEVTAQASVMRKVVEQALHECEPFSAIYAAAKKALQPNSGAYLLDESAAVRAERDALRVANQRDAQTYHDAAAETAMWRALLEEASGLDDASGAGCSQDCHNDFEDNAQHLARCFVSRVQAALAPDAGRALLTEVEALRTVAKAAHSAFNYINQTKLAGLPPLDAKHWSELNRALVELDALKVPQ